jgi:hypothetical protein
MLGVLNYAFGDARTIALNLKDFIASHPDMKDEFEEFDFIKLLDMVSDLEREIDGVMAKIKKEIERKE